jgi:hypothetical protein
MLAFDGSVATASATTIATVAAVVASFTATTLASASILLSRFNLLH